MTWIVIAIVVFALVVLGAVSAPLLGKLSGLQRAMLRLQRRQAEALELQGRAEQLQETIAGLEERAQTAGERVAIIKAGRDAHENGKHSLLKRA